MSPLDLHISSRSGSVRVTADDDGELDVDGGRLTVLADGTCAIEADGGSGHLVVRCPTASNVNVATASGKVVLSGGFGEVRVTSASGRVEIEDAAEVDVRSTSGQVYVHSCTGPCHVVARSGKVTIEVAGQVAVSSVSGAVEAELVDEADVRTVNGRVVIGTRPGGRVRVESVSGDVRVAVPDGTRPSNDLASLSGRIQNDCPEGTDGDVAVRTRSGAIRLTSR